MIDGEEGKRTDTGNGENRILDVGEKRWGGQSEGADGETSQRHSQEGSREKVGQIYFIETESGEFVKIC